MCLAATSSSNFNPHSREGSDADFEATYPLAVISIHTPAKGVTINEQDEWFSYDISIHTPAKGVTVITIAPCVISCDFNPHSREGSDLNIMLASAKNKNFNPHSREGSDGFRLGTWIQTLNFNPHSREGSDRFMGTVPSRT